jgi:hypothetical protein
VYQAVIPPVANSTNVLYGKCHRGHCNVLKVSSTMDPVTYYPDEVAAGSDPGATPEPVAANNAPVVATALPDMTITEATSVSHSVAANFTDADDDPLTYDATGLPVSLSIDRASGLISGIPTASEAGRLFSVTITATDPAAESASGSFTISVTAAPKPVQPVAAVISSGGGGSLSPVALFLLAVMQVRRLRRIRKTRRADARPRAIAPA